VETGLKGSIKKYMRAKSTFKFKWLIMAKVLTMSFPIWAFQKEPMAFVIPDPARQAQAIARDKDLAFTRLEIETKRELAKMRLLKPQDFFQLKSKGLENSTLLQSYIDEIDEALWGFKQKINPKSKIDFYSEIIKGKPIDNAKKIAKQQMFTHIRRNWADLKETIYNEFAFESWEKGGKTATIMNLNKSLIYVPNHGRSYLFKFGDSYVEIDKKTLKKGIVGIDVNSRLDKNKIAPEALNIVADDDGLDKTARSKNSASGGSQATPDKSSGANLPPAPQDSTGAFAPPGNPGAQDGSIPYNPPGPYYPPQPDYGTQSGYPGGVPYMPPPPAPYEPGFDLNNF
jgi:hypothetical protein